jgi:putative transposase
VIVFSEAHLRRLVARYADYYHRWRTHLVLAMDAPDGRPVHPPDPGAIIAIPEVGGVHHHYERRAAA